MHLGSTQDWPSQYYQRRKQGQVVHQEGHQRQASCGSGPTAGTSARCEDKMGLSLPDAGASTTTQTCWFILGSNLRA